MASLKSVCLLWAEEKAKKVKRSSMAAYSLIIRKHILPRFDDIGEITPEAIQAIVDDSSGEGLKTNTIKGILLVLGMIIRYSEKRGWLERREYDLRLPCRGEMSDPKTLSQDEERSLVSWLRGHPTRLNIGLLLCVCCGLRIGEVCALRWEDIDFQRKVITVRRTVYRIYDPDGKPRKSRLTVGSPKTPTSFREIPLASFLLETLIDFREKGEDGYIISGGPAPSDPQNLRNNFKRVLDTLGLYQRKVHSLRHSFATRCLESKCDIKTLSTLLGHANVTTTLNIYAHPDLSQKRKCIEDMLKII